MPLYLAHTHFYMIWVYSTDRSHGKLYAQQVEEIHKNLEDYVKSFEREMTDRERMIELLEQSEIFYDVQYGEAKIVANVRSTLIRIWIFRHMPIKDSFLGSIVFPWFSHKILVRCRHCRDLLWRVSCTRFVWIFATFACMQNVAVVIIVFQVCPFVMHVDRVLLKWWWHIHKEIDCCCWISEHRKIFIGLTTGESVVLASLSGLRKWKAATVRIWEEPNWWL